MMLFSRIFTLILGAFLIADAAAHMTMSQPPPIAYRTNPFYDVSKADFDYSAPLSPSGSNYPCRGMLKHLGTPAGGAVANWSPGGTYQMQFDGSATHAGGSCQASLSYDRGATFTVIKSYIGGCVGPQPGGTQTFPFTIPGNAPGGEAIFAWTWFNNQGNREMYMNCAVVNIGGGRNKAKRNLSGPSMFIANVGNGCSTPHGTDVVFPDPGPDVQYGGNEAARASPSGNCGGGNMNYVPPPITNNPGGDMGGNDGGGGVGDGGFPTGDGNGGGFPPNNNDGFPNGGGGSGSPGFQGPRDEDEGIGSCGGAGSVFSGSFFCSAGSETAVRDSLLWYAYRVAMPVAGALWAFQAL